MITTRVVGLGAVVDSPRARGPARASGSWKSSASVVSGAGVVPFMPARAPTSRRFALRRCPSCPPASSSSSSSPHAAASSARAATPAKRRLLQCFLTIRVALPWRWSGERRRTLPGRSGRRPWDRAPECNTCGNRTALSARCVPARRRRRGHRRRRRPRRARPHRLLPDRWRPAPRHGNPGLDRPTLVRAGSRRGDRRAQGGLDRLAHRRRPGSAGGHRRARRDRLGPPPRA